jgi:hypothetical protein
MNKLLVALVFVITGCSVIGEMEGADVYRESHPNIGAFCLYPDGMTIKVGLLNSCPDRRAAIEARGLTERGVAE